MVLDILFPLQILMSAVKAFLSAVKSVTTTLGLLVAPVKVDIEMMCWTRESALVWTKMLRMRFLLK